MKTVEKVLLLQDIEFLAGAPTESLARLAMAADYEEVPAGANLFSVGDRPGELIFLVNGKVTLSNPDGQSCHVEHTGLDFLSVIGEVPHIVSARAKTNCSLLRVSLDDLVELFTADAEFSWRVLRHLARIGRNTCGGGSVPEYPTPVRSSEAPKTAEPQLDG